MLMHPNNKILPTIIPRAEHGISRAAISKNALRVLYRLRDAGYQAYLVGGCVRDLLLEGHPKDFDVVTNASPNEVQRQFSNCRLIGRRFRLAHIHFNNEIIEVATFRGDPTDMDCDTDEHSVRDTLILRNNVYGNIDEDVWRRDFTVNALYYNIDDFSVVDYVHGMEDIRQRKLKLIGDPQMRYREDPVRLLRAIRFAAKLGFTIEQNTAAPISACAQLLGSVSSARLFEEVLKLFHAGSAVTAYELLWQYGIFKYLFPETANCVLRDETGQIKTFLLGVLASTDARVKEGKPVNPAFLFASFLWYPLRFKAGKDVKDSLPAVTVLQKSASAVLDTQIRITAIPRRFSTVMRDIWGFQHKLERYSGRQALGLLESRCFRAAYDFLCLRTRAGEETDERCVWWTELQTKSPEEQVVQAEQAISRVGKGNMPRNRRRNRGSRRRLSQPQT